ncbi:MAG: heavy metal sensor histidine kinase [Desulfuromonadaceae bacterium]|nr:heavy metal sensor histidine kinase [Desulfuromonadaceae bacterium]
MFLKNAKRLITRRRPWSITGRLAFLYTLSAVVTLGFVAIFFTWSLRDSISRVEEESIDNRIQVYGSIIENQRDYIQIIKNDIKWEGDNVGSPEYYARVLAGDKVLFETPGMSDVIPESWFSHPLQRGLPTEKRYLRHDVNGRHFLTTSREFKCYGGKETRIIQIASDISIGDDIVAKKQQIIGVFFFLGIILATGVGIIVARHALRPVRAITCIAEKITLARIDMRTDPKRWPTELRSLAIAFNGMLQRLEESFNRLSQLSSNLAHELRNPVNNLLVESGVVLGQTRTADEYRNCIESNVEDYQRLSRIIDSMLFLARAENPAIRIQQDWFNVPNEVNKIISFFEALAEEHNAVVVVSGTGNIYADRTMFDRAISNLLANALYYSPPGVRIEIAISRRDDDTIVITLNDTGFGISEEDLSQIFNRFYRGDKMREVHPEGFGLGLAIVKSVMDLHGGTITICSTTGSGTNVTLAFPPAKDDPVCDALT